MLNLRLSVDSCIRLLLISFSSKVGLLILFLRSAVV